MSGRRNWAENLSAQIGRDDRFIWMHCSSAGEFEQGKPICEALKNAYPAHKIILTFFSPSGYAVAQNYPAADVISYLPLDTRKNAEQFLDLVKPELGLFIKYEFWYHHLSLAAFRHVPVLLVSAVFRKEQIFFKPYGRFFRQMLSSFRLIFLQDEFSLQLLQTVGINQCRIGGDTRFDRVKKITESGMPVAFIDSFLLNKKALVAGSTWSDDENILKEIVASHPELKLVLAPHEVDENHLRQLQGLYPDAVLYSSLSETNTDAFEKQVLIVDCVGLLSRLYQHATITYVGGGFTRDGVHNVLEAAVWGKPVIYGANYKKYREARELIHAGGGFSIVNAADLNVLTGNLLRNEKALQEAGLKAKNYIDENTGATGKILQYIQEKRLLTRP